MLSGIKEFVRKEKVYVILLLLVGVLYGFFWAVNVQAGLKPPKNSEAVDEFRQAEKKMEEKISEHGSLKKYLENRPALSGFLSFISFFAAGAFSLGLIINLFLMFNPVWRKNLTSHIPPPHIESWQPSMLFRVIVLWLSGSMVLNFILLFLRQFFFPKVSMNVFLLVHTTFSDILGVAFIYYVIRMAGGKWRDVGLYFPKHWFQEIGVGLMGYLAVLPIFFAVLLFLVYLSHVFAYEPPPHPLVSVFLEEDKRSPLVVAYSVVLATVFAPFFEEVFFRGFCYSLFKNRWGAGWGMVISSAFFAMIHQSTFAFWPIFVLGMGLAYLYEKRRTLLPSIFLHVLHNSVFIAYFFLAKDLVSMEGGILGCWTRLFGFFSS